MTVLQPHLMREPSHPDTPKSTGFLAWWQTMPGFLTALAAVLSALAGLLVIVLPRMTAPAAVQPTAQPISTATATVRSTTQSEAPTLVTQGAPPPPQPTSVAPGAPSQVKMLPAGMEQTFGAGTVTYKILSARLEPGNGLKNYLRLGVRCTLAPSGPSSGVGFWSDSFRLYVDDAPRAPTNFLNALVDKGSAKDGEVLFEVPTTSRHVELQITDGEPGARIPFDLMPLAP